jgi:hypothetical protein
MIPDILRWVLLPLVPCPQFKSEDVQKGALHAGHVVFLARGRLKI